MQLNKYYEQIGATQINAESPRSYFIPYGDEENIFEKSREESNRFGLLNGNWSFAYYKNIDKVPDNVINPDIPIDRNTLTQVPGMWQRDGYDSVQYTNYHYPFPCDPPYIPTDNPVGVYSRDFICPDEWIDFEKYIVFEGVDAAFYLYINGRFVGYSECSHCMSEFKLDDYLINGKNRITVLVFKWCVGSYLEDQDKFRYSGIFRDVYLLGRTKDHIIDYEIRTDVSDDLLTAFIVCDIVASYPTDITVSLFDPDGNYMQEAICDKNGHAEFKITTPLLWNAESPELYRLLISGMEEYIPEWVGIKKIEIIDSVMYLNHKAIKLKGVNRHDANGYNGYVCDEQHMLRDIELMREHNINAVRTSHYPSDPRFYQMCDRYGLYVMSENDMECHGVEKPLGWNTLADNTQWYDKMFNRLSRMIESFKNRPCILAWSMGNESGMGINLSRLLAYTKDRDPSRFTHYEGVIHSDRFNRYCKQAPVEPGLDIPILPDSLDDECNDCHSRMYPNFSYCERFCNQTDNPRPLVLCEYAHSMGTSPGSLKEYWDIIYKYRRFMGAFIWEWCDHAFYDGKNEKGENRWLYGGDSGEKLHDSNFCVDGVVSPDRKPHLALKELKYTLQPVKMVRIQGNRFEIHNLYDFNYLSRLNGRFEVVKNGKVIQSGDLGALAIPAGESREVKVDFDVPDDGECYINFLYTMNGLDTTVPVGTEMAFCQFELETMQQTHSVMLPKTPIEVTEDARTVHIKGAGFHHSFSKIFGTFRQISFDQQRFFVSPMQFNIYRAPTDNDRNQINSQWCEFGYNRSYTRVYGCSVESNASEAIINCNFGMVSNAKAVFVKGVARWTVNRAGEISFSCHVDQDEKSAPLPRFGIRMSLDKTFDQVEYSGYGPHFSYCDMHQSCHKGLFSFQVPQCKTDNIKPQEYGNHYDTRWVKLCDGNGRGLEVCGESFEFSALPYTQEELMRTAHNYDLDPCGKTVFCCDAFQYGIGSDSCGPKPLDKYIPPHEFTFRLKIRKADTDGFAVANIKYEKDDFVSYEQLEF